MDGYVLWGCKGCGSAIVESMLQLAGLRYEFEEVDYTEPGPRRDRLLALNPLGQVPVLVLPDGSVMTESAAIAFHVDDRAPHAELVPADGEPMRDAFLRWLLFLVAAVYPTFTYGDEPRKWVGGAVGSGVESGAGGDECGKALRASTDEHRRRLWSMLEAGALAEPYFLGRFSAIDLYLAVMSNWRPGRDWFASNCPRLTAAAAAAAALPGVDYVLKRNFG
ncbi:MAG TPA: glutathione S-transferase family protein [Burkholderiaceae bacterium]